MKINKKRLLEIIVLVILICAVFVENIVKIGFIGTLFLIGIAIVIYVSIVTFLEFIFTWEE
jgi:hypothetical protein